MKLIAIDMDGTLVSKQLKVTKANKEAIEKAREEGHMVVIATGRSFDEAKYTLSEAELYLPLICVNGAEIRSDNWEKVTSIPIPSKQYFDIEKALRANDIYYEVYTSEGTYTDNREKAFKVMKDIVLTSNPEATEDDVHKAALRRFKLGTVNFISDYDMLMEKEGLEIYKVLAFSSEQEKIANSVDMLRKIDHLAVSSSANNNLEITNADAQKGVALEKFSKLHNISLKDTMAIGDNYNDVSMLEKAGISVAMGNAYDEIKQIAMHVTKTNDESGVAYAIENYLEEKKTSLA
ncbi:Cof-type HAD-IIB family hydrolase [Fictibacillus terranigra]|uniref:Cof-type HAD-IIB family hydrolase n=1 Tax=Fictibacillus terranigra TaxID=3058424 RepID=A0ABT8ECQ6_9BACL|nr:Cof-type HAD-IIB family hydrolase [Fictibacillus sp. CENA-BCM004]MDN4075685.1 Cof-type HAD-IIB family hydrolase [Fictibacillus sp. CENA-BCM004]